MVAFAQKLHKGGKASTANKTHEGIAKGGRADQGHGEGASGDRDAGGADYGP